MRTFVKTLVIVLVVSTVVYGVGIGWFLYYPRVFPTKGWHNGEEIQPHRSRDVSLQRLKPRRLAASMARLKSCPSRLISGLDV